MRTLGSKFSRSFSVLTTLFCLFLATVLPPSATGADLPSVQQLLKAYPPVGLRLPVEKLSAILDQVTQTRSNLPQNSSAVQRAQLDILEGQLRLELDAADAEGRQLVRALSAFVSAADALDRTSHADDWAKAQLGLARTKKAMAERDNDATKAIDAINAAEKITQRTALNLSSSHHLAANLLIGEVSSDLVAANRYATERIRIPYFAEKSLGAFSKADSLLKHTEQGDLPDHLRLSRAVAIAGLLNWDSVLAVDYPVPLTQARTRDLTHRALTDLNMPPLADQAREYGRQVTRAMILRHAALAGRDANAATQAVGILNVVIA